MTSLFNSIIANVLTGLYQPFWYAFIFSVIFMFTWKQYKSIRQAAMQWIEWFKKESSFRRMFLLIFYSMMILFKTLINRSMWANPVSNPIGVWGLYMEKNGEMIFTTEVPENLALFIPFTIFLLWTYREKLIGEQVKFGKVLWQSTKIVFLFSFTIEMLQLFLRLGTWQLSDLFYNTLGGFIGGLIYWIGFRIKHKKG